MKIARKWIFPTLRLLVFTLIAVALVKMAFFPNGVEAEDPARPSGQIVEAQVPVALGTITNNVTLTATISADAALPVKATAIGTVDELFLAAGSPVTAGDKIYDIRVETIRDPVETTDALGQVSISQPKPVITFAKVLAPATGVLSSLTVIHGQAVAVGDATGQVAPPSFSVSGSLSPDQQYRLQTRPTEASVTITNGPAPFTCTGLSVSTPLAGAAVEPTADGIGTTDGSGTTVTCAIPADVVVFSGLAAKITIAAGRAEDVLVVPTTAVEGSAATGVIWFVLPDGTTEQRPVTLGMTDGLSVQILEGVAEGDMVNEFVPGAVPPAPEGCTAQPDGSVTCMGGGYAP